MKRTLDKVKVLIRFLADSKHLRKVTVSLAALVVFVTTYVLILPAFTLEKQEAAEMGGIDIGVEQTADEDAVPAETDGAVEETTKTVYLADNSTLEFKGDGFAVSAAIDKKAKVPEGSELSVEEKDIKSKGFDFEQYSKDALDAVRKDADENADIAFIKFYDISLMSDGEAIDPSAAINLTIDYKDAVKADGAEDIRVINYAEDEKTGETEAVLLDDKKSNVETTVKDDELTETSFDAEESSLYAVVGTKTETIETEVITAKGDTYTVTAIYDPEATGIPAGATLKAEEITGEDADSYAVAAANKLDVPVDDISFARFFDITIVDEAGKEYHELGDGVQLSIRYKSAVELEEGQELNVVHFKDGLDNEPELIDADLSKDGKEIAFEQDSFSVTATVVTNTGQLAAGEYVIYAKVKQPDNTYKYYALSRFGGNNRKGTSTSASDSSAGAYSREITVNEQTGKVTYSGAYEDILWNLVKSGSYYQFRYLLEHEPATSGFYRYLTRYYGSLIISSSAENGDIWAGQSGNNAKCVDWEYDFDDHVLKNRLGNGLTFDTSSEMFNTTDSPSEVYLAKVDTKQSVKWPTPKVKYVDTSGKVISNGLRDWNSHILNAYLIYDIKDYTYVATRVGNYTTAGTAVSPVLRYGGKGSWFYTDSKLGIDPENNSGVWLGEKWHDLGTNTIYVVYEKTKEPVQGGTPVAHADGSREPVDPAIHKGSKSNNNGTNTLSLDITADTADQKVYKLADVIVVLDVSSSMSRKMGSHDEAGTGEDNRLTVAKRTINNVAETLIGDDTAFQVENSQGAMQKQIRMALISFDYQTHILQDFTDDYTTYKGKVDGASRHVGTNWEAALTAANNLSVDPERATFVIFVTDGNPSVRVTRGNLLTYSNSDVTYKPYSTFVDDKHVDVSLERSFKYLRAKGYFGDQKETDVRNFYPAIPVAQSIISHNKNLYAIGIGPIGSVDRLESLMQQAYGNNAVGSAHYRETDNADSLQEAFNQIVEQIAMLKGYSGISMYDGLTDLSSTVMEKSDLFGVSDDFEYWKAPAPEGWKTMTDAQKQAYLDDVRENGLPDSSFEPWDPASENCDPATFDSATNAVRWDMGNSFMPKSGCTYRVTFKVWPSQEAYDLVSDLNNGVMQYSELDQDIRNQIHEVIDPATGAKSYTMKTNRDGANTTYSKAEKTGDSITITGDGGTLPFNSVPDMPLTKTQMGIEKHWNDTAFSNNRPGYIYLAVLRDGQGIYRNNLPSDAQKQTPASDNVWYSESNGCYYYKTTAGGQTKYQYVVKLMAASSPEWQSSTFISPGLKVDGKVLEPGHDYTFAELPDDYHYELNGAPVHPMLIDSASEIYDGASGNALVNFKVTNDLRGGIDVKKEVHDTDGKDISSQDGIKDKEFTFTVKTLTLPQGVNEDVWYSMYDSDGTQIDLAPNDPNEKSAVIHEGDTFTLKPGQFIRLLNVPIGTLFEVTENDPSASGYSLFSISQFWNDVLKVTEQVTQGKLTANKVQTVANTNYRVLFVNRPPAFDIDILKVDVSDASKLLQGAEFSLYSNAACTEFAKDSNGSYVGTPRSGDGGSTIYVLTTNANSRLTLGSLPAGTYYLKEIKAPVGYVLPEDPVEIIVSASDVRANQNGNPAAVVTSTADGKITYTIKVKNTAGEVLPNTGGTGTLPYTLGGSALMIAAALMYGLRMRRRERRSE